MNIGKEYKCKQVLLFFFAFDDAQVTHMYDIYSLNNLHYL